MGFISAREKAGLTQAQVAKALGVTSASVYHWESGRNLPRRELLPKLAKLYDCTVADLLNVDSVKTLKGFDRAPENECAVPRGHEGNSAPELIDPQRYAMSSLVSSLSSRISSLSNCISAIRVVSILQSVAIIALAISVAIR